MPITILFRLCAIALIVLLFANIVLPLLSPRYQFFWMFRQRVTQAARKLNRIKNEQQAAQLEQQADEARRKAGALKKNSQDP